MAGSLQTLTAIPGNENALQRLREVVTSGKAIAFVGAGASADLCPLWTSLIHRLAQLAVAEGLASEQDRNYWIRQATAKPLDVLSLINNKVGDSSFRAAIRKLFGPPPSGDCFTAVHSALMCLPFAGYVTTNYDACLLYARHKLHPNDNPIAPSTWKDQEALHGWLTGDILHAQHPILFAHGFYDRTETIVATLQQYRKAYNDGFYPQVFRKLWTQERLVLIGYGFSDPWLDFLSQDAVSEATLEVATDPRHVAIIGLPDDMEYTPDMRRLYANRYGTYVVFYPVTITRAPEYAEDHSELLRILRIFCPPSSTGPDPSAFYSGGRPTEADISADLDVPRTQYQSSWDDEFGRPQKPWKELMLRWALTSPQDQKSRVGIVYGHRGSGKTTL